MLIRDAAVVSVTPITSDEQRVTASMSIGAGGYVRAEVRGAPEVDPADPLAGRTDMEAVTNPILLAVGRAPDDAAPVDASPGPPGPRRLAATGAEPAPAGPTLPPQEAMADLVSASLVCRTAPSRRLASSTVAPPSARGKGMSVSEADLEELLVLVDRGRQSRIEGTLGDGDDLDVGQDDDMTIFAPFGGEAGRGPGLLDRQKQAARLFHVATAAQVRARRGGSSSAAPGLGRFQLHPLPEAQVLRHRSLTELPPRRAAITSATQQVAVTCRRQ